jgi:hypothetical protein
MLLEMSVICPGIGPDPSVPLLFLYSKTAAIDVSETPVALPAVLISP